MLCCCRKCSKEEKAGMSSYFEEIEFSQEKSAQEKIQEERGEVIPQTSFLTSGVGLMLYNKVKKSQTSQMFSLLPASLQYPSVKKGMSAGFGFWLNVCPTASSLPSVPLLTSQTLCHPCLPLQNPSQRPADPSAGFM